MRDATPWTDEDRAILERGLSNRTNNLGTLMRDERRDADMMALFTRVNARRGAGSVQRGYAEWINGGRKL